MEKQSKALQISWKISWFSYIFLENLIIIIFCFGESSGYAIFTTQIFSPFQLAELLVDFVQNIGFRNSANERLIESRIKCINKIIQTELFSKLPDCQKLLLDEMAAQVICLLDDNIQMESTSNLLQDLIDKCTSPVSQLEFKIFWNLPRNGIFSDFCSKNRNLCKNGSFCKNRNVGKTRNFAHNCCIRVYRFLIFGKHFDVDFWLKMNYFANNAIFD